MPSNCQRRRRAIYSALGPLHHEAPPEASEERSEELEHLRPRDRDRRRGVGRGRAMKMVSWKKALGIRGDLRDRACRAVGR